MLVLLYHGVRPESDTSSSDIRTKHVPERIFKKQLKILKRFFHVMPFSDVVDSIQASKPLPWNACTITFDDGYANNALVAAPILKELGLPAIFFITTDFIDQKSNLWVDRFEVAFSKLYGVSLATDTKERERLKKLSDEERTVFLDELEQKAQTAGESVPLYKSMTWDHVRNLVKDGFEIGAHTQTHPILSKCSSATLHRELVESKMHLESKLGKACVHFAYPNGQAGDWNKEVLEIVRENYKSGCTTLDNFVKKGQDIHLIPRVTIDMGSSIIKFLIVIFGLRSALRKLK